MKYIIVGPQASGKTTMVKRLAKDDTAVFDDGDEVRTRDVLANVKSFIVTTESEVEATRYQNFWPDAKLIRLEQS